MAVKPIPDGYHSVTPYLVVQGVAKLIDFLKQAFDAKEIERMAGPDGSVMHGEVRIGDSVVMMGEAWGESKPIAAALYLYVNDTDVTYRRALQAGRSTGSGSLLPITMLPRSRPWGTAAARLRAVRRPGAWVHRIPPGLSRRAQSRKNSTE